MDFVSIRVGVLCPVMADGFRDKRIEGSPNGSFSSGKSHMSKCPDRAR